MKIEHIAIWTRNLENMKNFYMNYFKMNCGPKYENKNKNFSSYFLTFGNSKTRIELMHRPDIARFIGDKENTNGFAHFAISVGSKAAVDALTEEIRNDGLTVKSEPRITGDGYYESVVLDVEGNCIEITE